MRPSPNSCINIFRCIFSRGFLPIILGKDIVSVPGLHFSNSAMSESELLVGVCQITSGSDVGKNVETCKKLIRRAKGRGAKMVFLPEAFDYIAENKEMTLSLAHTVDGEIIKDFSQLAKDLNIWLSLGSFHEKYFFDSLMELMQNDVLGNPCSSMSSCPEESRIHNTHLILANDGSVVAKYNKLHLFDVDIKGGVKLTESENYIPGKELPPVVKTPVGNVGLSICYDLRFPELSLMLAQQGADILTFPSAFTCTTGAAHWETLLKARAIETQCYVIAAAQTGQHNAKRKSYGHTMVVDPWGQVITQCHEGEDVCIASIDLEYLKKVRAQMPVWKHRRHDVYGKMGPLG